MSPGPAPLVVAIGLPGDAECPGVVASGCVGAAPQRVVLATDGFGCGWLDQNATRIPTVVTVTESDAALPSRNPTGLQGGGVLPSAILDAVRPPPSLPRGIMPRRCRRPRSAGRGDRTPWRRRARRSRRERPRRGYPSAMPPLVLVGRSAPPPTATDQEMTFQTFAPISWPPAPGPRPSIPIRMSYWPGCPGRSRPGPGPVRYRRGAVVLGPCVRPPRG
jgi:hypothetical protein